MEKKLYPLKFIPVASERPWGGSALVKTLGKRFIVSDEDGNETLLGADKKIGESWELADMGVEDSVVAEGWLAGNTISELMETYLENIVGEDVYHYYGRQFPLLIKFLDINDRLSVQVHPDDEVAAERYDSLGKAEIWYIMDAQPGARIYAGFNRDITAQELYDRCRQGTVEEVLNVIYPKKGDALFITPGTVHAADGGILVAEIQESSDMTFRLYDWGREFNPATARPLHLDEAIDIIDYRAFDAGLFRKGPLWGEEASHRACHTEAEHCDCGCHEDGRECHCHEDGHECHCHKHQSHSDGNGIAETLVECPEFCVSELNLSDSLHIYTEKFGSFIIYICTEGAASLQVPSTQEDGKAYMQNYEISKGETVLVPADMDDFFLVPRDRETVLLEAVCRPVEEMDGYIDPDTEAYLEGEDYEGLEDGLADDVSDSSETPLTFFGQNRFRS